MRRTAFLLTTFLLLGAVAFEARGEELLLDRVAAVVNGQVITLSEVRAAAAPSLEGLPTGIDREAARVEAMKRALDALIDEKLLAQETRAREIHVTEAEIDRAVVEVRRQHGLTDSEFRQAIRSQGYTWESYRDELKDQLERYKLLGAEVQARVEITDEDVRSYLARRGSGRPVEEARVRHILVRVPEEATEPEEQEFLRRAEQSLERIRAGEDFAQVASDVSDDPSARTGGDLGWLRKGRMVRALDDAVFQASEGEVLGPVRSPFGFHVIEVVEHRRTAAERDEMMEHRSRQRLMEEALEEETRRFLNGLRRRAVIEIKMPEVSS